MGQSLAVKYRPHDWTSVTEQSTVVAILQNQILANELQHAYLFCGSAGCGKTTCARIFANEINKGLGSPIELDAASNNGVDDIRQIIQQAQMKSLTSEYKVFVLDECLTGDAEVLTSHGFKRFDALDKTERIAQYNDDGTIEFVYPNEFISMHYTGNLKVWNPRNWCTVRMTPNHVQPLHYVKSGKIREHYAKDLRFSQSNDLIVSGNGIGVSSSDIEPLSILDRLAIICQANGSIQYTRDNYTRWSVSFKKQRKIERFLKLCSDGNIVVSEININRDGYRRFTFSLPNTITKKFSTHFSLSMSYDRAREFIDELKNWDGSVCNGFLYYSSKDKDNVDFASAVATLAGYSSRVRIECDNRKDIYSNIHRLYLYDTKYVNCKYVKNTYHDEWFDGTVYCVKVPSHKIVIRVDGFTFITGNCHSLSTNAWQAMLKLLEEPPAKTIFIMCTTNPERIPKTILSRVQRYQFQRISQQGIVERLKTILFLEDEEILSNGGPDGVYRYSCQDEALEYIAKISDGGLRDALTLLDKCLAYSSELTLENVVKAIGATDYDTMIRITKALFSASEFDTFSIVDSVHSSGKDLKLFIHDYLEFVMDICKYDVTRSFSFIKVPSFYKADMDAFANHGGAKLLKCLLRLNSDVKYETSPKMLIEATFYEFCLGEKS